MISSVTCQHCGNAFEAEIVDKTEFCPHCGKETSVRFVPPKEAPAPAAPTKTYLNPAQRAAGTVDGLRLHASQIVTTAVILFILAGLALLITMISTVDTYGDTSRRYWSNGLTVAGCFCSSAVALYIIAQIVHIRANTLK